MNEHSAISPQVAARLLEKHVIITAHFARPPRDPRSLAVRVARSLSGLVRQSTVEWFVARDVLIPSSGGKTTLRALPRVLAQQRPFRTFVFDQPRSPLRDNPVERSMWWSVGLASRRQVGRSATPLVVLNVGINFRKLLPEHYGDLRESLVDLIGAIEADGECTSALIDCALAVESESGTCFSAESAGPDCTWHRGLEWECWRQCADRSQRVFGVYWGTYLSDRLRRRAQLDRKAIAEFLALPTGSDPDTLRPLEGQWARRFRSGGILLGMSPGVLEVAEPGLAPGMGIEGGCWLRERLMRRGLLA